MSNLSAEDIDQLAAILMVKMFDEKRARWIEPEEHHEQHQWIRSKMLDENEMRKLRRKIIESAVIWAVPIIIGFVCAVFWDGLLQMLKRAG